MSRVSLFPIFYTLKRKVYTDQNLITCEVIYEQIFVMENQSRHLGVYQLVKLVTYEKSTLKKWKNYFM